MAKPLQGPQKYKWFKLLFLLYPSAEALADVIIGLPLFDFMVHYFSLSDLPDVEARKVAVLRERMSAARPMIELMDRQKSKLRRQENHRLESVKRRRSYVKKA